MYRQIDRSAATLNVVANWCRPVYVVSLALKYRAAQDDGLIEDDWEQCFRRGRDGLPVTITANRNANVSVTFGRNAVMLSISKNEDVHILRKTIQPDRLNHFNYFHFTLRCEPQTRDLHRPHYDEDDDRDYFVVKKRPKKHRPHKKKIVVEVNDYDEGKYEDEYSKEDEDEERYHRKEVATHHKKPRRYRHHGWRRPSHHRRRRRRKNLKKRLLWDRQSAFDADEDDIVDGGDFVEDIDDEATSLTTDDYDDHSESNILKKKGSNWRTGNLDLRPIESSSNSDRSFSGFFEPSMTINGHRNIPMDYLNNNNNNNNNRDNDEQTDVIESRSDSDSSANRRLDLNSYFDRSYGRSLRNPEQEIDFDMASSFFRKPNVTTTTTTTTMLPTILYNGTTKNEYRRNGKEKAVFDMPSRYRRVYSKWSKWTKCTAKCTTRRIK